MSLWTSTTIPLPSVSATQVPASTIAYTPVATVTPVTEVLVEGKRYYAYNNEVYPSITTLLSATNTEGQTALRKWRASIGHARAAEITASAAARGTRWHTFCEQFVSSQPIAWSVLTEPRDVTYASVIAHTLNDRLSAVLASETRVASSVYGVAGRLDLAVRLRDGRSAILDFKTGGAKAKSGTRLDQYGMQATFYADALSEQWTHDPIETIVIMQLLTDRVVWQESSPSHYREALRERIAQYAQQQSLELGA